MSIEPLLPESQEVTIQPYLDVIGNFLAELAEQADIPAKLIRSQSDEDFVTLETWWSKEHLKGHEH